MATSCEAGPATRVNGGLLCTVAVLSDEVLTPMVSVPAAVALVTELATTAAVAFAHTPTGVVMITSLAPRAWWGVAVTGAVFTV